MGASRYWWVNEIWPGATVAIIGGGPSLARADVELCRGRARVIACNDAYLLAPWADALMFSDEKWWAWHKDRPELRAFAGIRAALETAGKGIAGVGAHALRNYGPGPGLAEQRDGVRHGWNTGYQAINLAVHMGARRIVLLGFDMKVAADGRQHWHRNHRMLDGPAVYASKMLPCFATLVEPLTRRGIAIVNATRDTALTVFPRLPIDKALALESVPA